MSVLPGAIRQIGYVVTDLDQAMQGWLDLGVGPWFVIRGLQMRALYRGEPCETTISMALSNSGEMQIELIAQQDDTASIYTEFLRAEGPGYHQLAYWTEDFEATMTAVEQAGWPVVWSGGEGFGVRFAYLRAAQRPGSHRADHRDLRTHRHDGRELGTHPRSGGRLGRYRPDPGIITCRASSPCPSPCRRRPSARRTPTDSANARDGLLGGHALRSRA